MDLTQLQVLDGASGTLLQDRNVKLHPTLWSAIALVDNVEAVEDMHRAYYDAGANIASTVTYQASFPGFAQIQTDEKTASAMSNSVELARNAANTSTGPQHPKFVAASLGPYGAYLCGGQEYTGDYGTVTDKTLYEFHKPRFDAVLAGRPDVVLFETIPTIQETRVIAELVKQQQTHVPVWIAFSVRSESTVTLADGTALEEAVAITTDFPVVGANCFPLTNVCNVLQHFSKVTQKPLIVYPNSGEIYDAVSKTWSLPSPKRDAGWDIEDWYSRGARVIGGCCRTDPALIQDISKRSAAINQDRRSRHSD